MHAGESVTEKGGQKKQRNSVKLGFAGEERVTEEGGHRHATVVWRGRGSATPDYRHGAKKQLNSVKLGFTHNLKFIPIILILQLLLT